MSKATRRTLFCYLPLSLIALDPGDVLRGRNLINRLFILYTALNTVFPYTLLPCSTRNNCTVQYIAFSVPRSVA